MNKRDEDIELRGIIKPLRDRPALDLTSAPHRLMIALAALEHIAARGGAEDPVLTTRRKTPRD